MHPLQRCTILLTILTLSGIATLSVQAQPAYPDKNVSPTGESLSKVPDDAANVIRAEIISVSENTQEIKFKDVVTGNHLTTRVADPSTLGSFVAGDRVRITFSSPDTTTATSVVADESAKK